MTLRQQLSLIVLNYLRYFARKKLKAVDPIIIGVTGSAGKTSCRKAIAKILRTKGIVKESLHSNSESGISLNILGLAPIDYSIFDWLRLCFLAPFQLLKKDKYDYYVAEMEADESKYPKNMDYLLSIIKPDIGVYVSAGVVHSAGFDDLITDHHPDRRKSKLEAAIVAENGKLLTSLGKSGTAIYYRDNKHIEKLASKLRCRTISVGQTTKSSLKLAKTEVGKFGFRANYLYQGVVYNLSLSLILEEHYGLTYGLALGVGAALGIPLAQGITALEQNIIVPPGRLRIFPGVSGSTIIDSSYNSSPETAASTLALLRRVAGRARAIAVIGDMRELGTLSKQAHQKLAAEIMTSCDSCYLFGQETKQYTLPRLVAAKFPVYHFEKMADLTKTITKNIPPKAWVLVKGSQNTILLERVVE